MRRRKQQQRHSTGRWEKSPYFCKYFQIFVSYLSHIYVVSYLSHFSDVCLIFVSCTIYNDTYLSPYFCSCILYLHLIHNNGYYAEGTKSNGTNLEYFCLQLYNCIQFSCIQFTCNTSLVYNSLVYNSHNKIS